ncbi:MAG: alpha/beta hydrolase-fold protein [Planctomycetota bacterium]|nr:alpha/beta hydrolase-fold protein [Planctomycetota bacterium]MDA1213993.1 alpha/beta hydrolase-fold protein [Planctomycetota bacterium]
MRRPYSFSFDSTFDRMNFLSAYGTHATGQFVGSDELEALLAEGVSIDDILQELDNSEEPIENWLPERTALFIPENYEPRYAYPLIVWLHSEGSSERQLLDLMPKISDRNYIGVSIRGALPDPNALPGQYRWGQTPSQCFATANEIDNVIRPIQERFHVNSSRVYLAGFGNGASMALQVAFSHPERFAGVAALGGLWPKNFTPLANYRELRETRVLMGTGRNDSQTSINAVSRAAHLLHAAGLQPAVREYDASHELTAEMLTDVNHWVMSGISSAYIAR